MQEIDIRRWIEAEPAVLWELIDDSSSWPTWTPIDSFELARERSAGGTGEIRIFTTGRVRVCEEIVERQPQRRLSYVLLSGLAVRHYRADIDLAPVADGTELRWHTTFDAKAPGSGWLYRRALTRATGAFVDGLARQVLREHAARPA